MELSTEVEGYVKYLKFAIESGDTDKFDEALDDWETVGMLPGQEKDIVVSLISTMANHDATEILEVLVSFMEISGIGYEYVSVLFSYPLDTDSLDFIVKVYNPDYFTTVRDLLAYSSGDSDDTRIAIANIKTVFSDIESTPSETISELLIIAVRESHKPICDYLDSLIIDLKSPKAVRPSWIIASNKTHTALVKELIITPPARWTSDSVEEDALYIISITEDDKDLDILYDNLVEKFSQMSSRQREELISMINWNNELMLLGDRVDIFRVFGMSMPRGIPVPLQINSKDPCLLWGGCRALICWHNENIDIDTGDKIVEDPVDENRLEDVWWFDGSCNYCNIRVEKECYALRIPLETGGFVGCYCSFECMRDRVRGRSLDRSNVSATYTGYEIGDEPNHNRMYLIDKMEEVYNKFGVWDRI